MPRKGQYDRWGKKSGPPSGLTVPSTYEAPALKANPAYLPRSLAPAAMPISAPKEVQRDAKGRRIAFEETGSGSNIFPAVLQRGQGSERRDGGSPLDKRRVRRDGRYQKLSPEVKQTRRDREGNDRISPAGRRRDREGYEKVSPKVGSDRYGEAEGMLVPPKRKKKQQGKRSSSPNSEPSPPSPESDEGRGSNPEQVRDGSGIGPANRSPQKKIWGNQTRKMQPRSMSVGATIPLAEKCRRKRRSVIIGVVVDLVVLVANEMAK